MKKLLLLCVLSSCSVISDVFVKSIANQEFALGTLESGVYSQYIATFDSSGNMTTDFSYSAGSSSSGSSTGSYRLLKTTSDTVGIYEAGSSYTKVEVSGSTLKVYESVNSESGAESQTSVLVTLNKQL